MLGRKRATWDEGPPAKGSAKPGIKTAKRRRGGDVSFEILVPGAQNPSPSAAVEYFTGK